MTNTAPAPCCRGIFALNGIALCFNQFFDVFRNFSTVPVGPTRKSVLLGGSGNAVRNRGRYAWIYTCVYVALARTTRLESAVDRHS